MEKEVESEDVEFMLKEFSNIYLLLLLYVSQKEQWINNDKEQDIICINEIARYE